jgi:hypothetical protein
MSKELKSSTVSAPGFYGINTQGSGALLSDGFALTANNCIIDQYGRIGARKGWVMRTTSGSTPLNGSSIKSIFEYINANGDIDYISAGNHKLFTGGTNGALTDITPASYTITKDNWQMVSLYDHCLIVQKTHEPIIFTRETGSLVVNKLVSHVGHGGASFSSPVFGTGTANGPNCALAAYGRFWVAGTDNNKTTLYWSTDIADTHFPTFDTGAGRSSGSINMSAKLPNNTDEIVGLAAHNGYIIVFFKQNIVMLRGNDDNFSNPSTMYVQDVLPGVGCIARDSIQKTGNDVLFLSVSGVRSIARTVQEKSMPMRELTTNIRDDLISALESINVDDIRSVYSEKYAFYVLSLPASSYNFVYCLDMRKPLEDGSARVTTWQNYQADAFCAARNGKLYIGKTNGIGEYFGYQDNGSHYSISYYTNYFTFDAPTINKIVKAINIVLIGGGGQRLVTKLGFDYSNSYSSFPIAINTATYAEYNVAEYNVDEYSSGVFIENAKASMGGQGKVIQIGVEADVNGAPLSVQKIDVFVKVGKNY